MKYAETKRLIPDSVTAPNVHKYLNYVLNATAIQKYSMAVQMMIRTKEQEFF